MSHFLPYMASVSLWHSVIVHAHWAFGATHLIKLHIQSATLQWYIYINKKWIYDHSMFYWSNQFNNTKNVYSKIIFGKCLHISNSATPTIKAYYCLTLTA